MSESVSKYAASCFMPARLLLLIFEAHSPTSPCFSDPANLVRHRAAEGHAKICISWNKVGLKSPGNHFGNASTLSQCLSSCPDSTRCKTVPVPAHGTLAKKIGHQCSKKPCKGALPRDTGAVSTSGMAKPLRGFGVGVARQRNVMLGLHYSGQSSGTG